MKTKDVGMLSGSVFKGLLAMTMPIMAMNVFQSLFSVIDMTVLGIMVDDNAVGAVGASGMLITLTTGLLIGIATGSTVVVAKHISREETEALDRAIGTSVLFSVISGIALMFFGIFSAKILLGLINCHESLIVDAAVYFRIYFVATPFILLYNFCASILRANGDAKRPMMFLMIGGIVKLVLNIALTSIFDVTVEGVAIATVLSNAVSAALVFRALCKGDGTIKFKTAYLKIYWEELKDILFIGVPAGLQSALYSLANTVISATVNTFGAAATKGVSIANQFDAVMYHVATAPSLAAVSFVSQNIGAGNIKRAKESVYKSVLITVMFAATLGSLSAIFSPQLSGIMSSDSEVISFSTQKMIIVSSTYFICGIKEVICATLRGLNKPIVSTITTFLYMCVLRFVWVYLIFPLCPNLTFLYLVWPIGWILCIATDLLFCIPEFKRLERMFS